jgi:hypothetical protein
MTKRMEPGPSNTPKTNKEESLRRSIAYFGAALTRRAIERVKGNKRAIGIARNT